MRQGGIKAILMINNKTTRGAKAEFMTSFKYITSLAAISSCISHALGLSVVIVDKRTIELYLYILSIH